MKSSSGNFLIGFISGAIAGALAGVLLAPDKGSETRKKVTEKAKKIKDDLEKDFSAKVDDLKDYVNESVNDVKSKFSKAEKKVEAVEAEVRKAAK
ncbi:MAG: YtxH domain-containing protein [Bacteroidales bacterium]|nr:YtxH domain-containing protein [Bacteroidales bacterium]